ncbi:MAG: hypothetical protein IPK32_04070 [Verrucomicrobiaceae bacterium]|nr:hypothetical protein [Verrucomicrobiaceae bacterium]
MNPIPNPSRQKNARQYYLSFSFFAAHLFVGLLVTSAIAQSPATQQHLTFLRTAYEAAYQTEVAAGHATALTDLNAKYSAALDRALASATQAGQLDTALALRDEKKRLAAAAPLPADDFAAPETLKTLRLTYRSALSNLELRRDQTAAPVKAKYDAALEALQTELTKAADLDGAVAVKTLREGLKTEAAPKAAAVVVEKAKPAAPPAPTPAATAKDDITAARQLAEWVFAAERTVAIIKKGAKEPLEIKSAAELPPEDWSLHAVNQSGHSPNAPEFFPWELLSQVPTVQVLMLNQKVPLGASAAQAINTLPDLKHLDYGNCVYTLPMIEALRPNDKMIYLRFGRLEGAPQAMLGMIADRFPQLVSLELNSPITAEAFPKKSNLWPALTKLTLVGSLTTEITAQVAKLPKLSAFNSIEWRDTAPDSEALTKLQNLQKIGLRRCKAPELLISALKALPELTSLELSPASMDVISTTSLEMIADLPHLTEVSLDGSTSKLLGQDHLEPLTKLKNVKKLKLQNHHISPEGIARLKKALPKCIITH